MVWRLRHLNSAKSHGDPSVSVLASVEHVDRRNAKKNKPANMHNQRGGKAESPSR